MKYDVAVAYRIYPGISKTPAYYSEDKMKMSEMCLSSFKRSLGNIKAKIYAILDNCPDEYITLFEKYFDKADLVIIRESKIGNFATFKLQIKLLLEQTESEYIYFAEDDYFYMDDTFHYMLDLMQSSPQVNFVTPYDHLDYYITKAHAGYQKIHYVAERHWRESNSTCLTFLTTKKILKETKTIFHTYSKKSGDFPIFLGLTQGWRFWPKVIPWLFSGNKDMREGVLKAGFFFSWRMLRNKKYKLYSPIPTLATHMETTGISPGFNWQAIFQEASNLHS